MRKRYSYRIIQTILLWGTGSVILLLSGCREPSGWERITLPTTDGIHALEFINNSTGWALTYGTGLILKTTDAGKNWEVCSRLDSAYYERIQFTGRSHGWICGEKNSIYKTEDGGKTWASQSVKIEGFRFYFYSMYFRNSQEGTLGGMKMDLHKNRTNILLTTTSAGKSWIKTENNPPLFVMDMEYLDNDLAFVCGENSIYRTTDGGKTWQMVYTQDLAREGFRDLYFTDRRYGFAVNAKGDVIRSSDGGHTWSSQSLTRDRLRAIIFINKKEGFIAKE